MKRIFTFLIISLATATVALAQPPDVSKLEASGNKHYELAEYDAAIADFKEAYRISDQPGYLFNIAQAFKKKGDCRQASTFYKNYLRRAPDAQNRDKIQQWIAEMDECAAKQPVVTTPPPTTTNTPPPTTTALAPAEPPEEDETPSAPPASEKTWMKYAGFGGLGIGALGLGLGLKFALDGKASNQDLKDKCAVSCTSEEALAIQSDGRAANRKAAIFTIVGGAAVAGGAVLVVLWMRSRSSETASDEEPAASISFNGGGATAAYAWRF